MTINLRHPTRTARTVTSEISLPFNRLREHFHAEGSSLIACLEFVADEGGAAAGHLLIDEARRATAWTRALDRRVERVRALLMLEHLDCDDDALVGEGIFDDLGAEAVHACCLHADVLSALRDDAAMDGLSRPKTRPIPLRPAMRPALRPHAVKTLGTAHGPGVTSATSRTPIGQGTPRAV